MQLCSSKEVGELLLSLFHFFKNINDLTMEQSRSDRDLIVRVYTMATYFICRGENYTLDPIIQSQHTITKLL